jgi:hypothetical protein
LCPWPRKAVALKSLGSCQSSPCCSWASIWRWWQQGATKTEWLSSCRPILLPPIGHYKRAALLLLIFCTSLLALIAPGITRIPLIEDWPFPICISRLWLGLSLVVVLLLL